MTGAPPIPRVELAHAPTPLLKLERLSQELGVELWVKRDDLTGLLETGNKIRKLEFLVGEAFAQRADTLITCGTLQSNCCRTVAAVAARLGLKAMLALRGAPPAEYDGNLLLDRLLGAEIRYCTEAEWARIGEVLEDLAARARTRGGTPYVIPESGATVAGALGYVACGEEIAQQIRHGAPEFGPRSSACRSRGRPCACGSTSPESSPRRAAATGCRWNRRRRSTSSTATRAPGVPKSARKRCTRW
ncbi:MAG: pyridoxal-phosphate dependent enzyme [Candidatus Rokubacteria bacterium]|nr:pyridoxal-phosphate dependent enzyme [Candidatus Rokubacteria bacterium]